MHPSSIFAQTLRLLASRPLASRPCTQRKPPAAARAHSMARGKGEAIETRLEKRGRGDSHAEGGGACTRRTKRKTTPVRHRAPAALGRHNPTASNAHGATPPLHRTSLALSRLILVRDVPFGGAALFFFLCGVEQTPVFMWRVVVVGGLCFCARRREVQIWRGGGPRCGHFT